MGVTVKTFGKTKEKEDIKEKNQVYYCPKCGSKFVGKIKYCNNCGLEFNWPKGDFDAVPIKKKGAIKSKKEGDFNNYTRYTLDVILNGEVDLIINTPKASGESVIDDGYLRKAAIKKKIPYMTTMAAAKATASGIETLKKHGSSEVKSLQELHASIK